MERHLDFYSLRLSVVLRVALENTKKARGSGGKDGREGGRREEEEERRQEEELKWRLW